MTDHVSGSRMPLGAPAMMTGPLRPEMNAPREAIAAPASANMPAALSQAPVAKSLPAVPELRPEVQSEMKGLVKDMAAAPPVDSAKVARLKGLISAGAYPLQPARIADAMFASLANGRKPV